MTIDMALASCYVPPDQSANNPADVGLVDTEFLGDLRLRFTAGPSTYFNNVAFGQYPVEHFSLGLTVLLQLVGDVVIVRSQEQMVVVYAQSIVAFMQDVESFWDWTNKQVVCDTMREYSAERSVSSDVLSSSPKNAALGCSSTHVFGESLRSGQSLPPSLLAYSGTELPVSSQNFARNGVEFESFSTQFAGTHFSFIEVSHGLNFKRER